MRKVNESYACHMCIPITTQQVMACAKTGFTFRFINHQLIPILRTSVSVLYSAFSGLPLDVVVCLV